MRLEILQSKGRKDIPRLSRCLMNLTLMNLLEHGYKNQLDPYYIAHVDPIPYPPPAIEVVQFHI